MSWHVDRETAPDARRLLLFLLVAGGGWGCASTGGGGGASALDADALARKYPTRRYVVGQGFSTAGAAAAEAEAKARVAESLQSEIQTLLRVESSDSSTSAGSVATSRVEQVSRFEHAEWIRIAPGSTVCNRQGCRAVALLDREEAMRNLMGEYGLESAPMRAAARRALAEADVGAFTAAFREAERSFQRVRLCSIQARCITGSEPDAYRSDRGTWQEVLAARDRILGGIRVTVVTGRVTPPEADERVVNALAGALTRLGVAASTGNTCSRGYELVPETEFSCRGGYFGPVCGMVIRGSLRSCGEGPSMLVDLSEARLSGAHPSSEGAAREAALGKISASELSQALGRQLSGVWPLGSL